MTSTTGQDAKHHGVRGKSATHSLHPGFQPRKPGGQMVQHRTTLQRPSSKAAGKAASGLQKVAPGRPPFGDRSRANDSRGQPKRRESAPATEKLGPANALRAGPSGGPRPGPARPEPPKAGIQERCCAVERERPRSEAPEIAVFELTRVAVCGSCCVSSPACQRGRSRLVWWPDANVRVGR